MVDLLVTLGLQSHFHTTYPWHTDRYSNQSSGVYYHYLCYVEFYQSIDGRNLAVGAECMHRQEGVEGCRIFLFVGAAVQRDSRHGGTWSY
jgi:hypothetical protein